MLAAGITPDRVRVVVGALARNTGKMTQFEGHSWPMYRNAHGVWCILEPNIPHLPIAISRGELADPVLPARPVGIHRAIFLAADRLAADGCREQYVPLVCMNHQSVWTVEQRKPDSVRGARGLEPEWSKNPTFEEILRAGRNR